MKEKPEMKQFAFVFDDTRCSGCFACVVACQDQNDRVGVNVAFRQVVFEEFGSPSAGMISPFSISCFHCGDAPCRTVCPTKAISRKEATGSVVVDREKCIGCHSCLYVCPFGAPQFDRNGKMVKCDLCAVRIGAGMQPACARVCSTKALDVRPLEEISRQKATKATSRFLSSGRRQES